MAMAAAATAAAHPTRAQKNELPALPRLLGILLPDTGHR